ncbi:calmodulin-binding protein 60 C [Gossypium australe]|uniref:Calmodulin-binding protein 60 C n=1 Tax=Gossypium australe TaxID=47621 RepID=A0A5B6WXX6_9ROSI|nr:calmodulin-binding protein 60 C [Gossypium australe]
MQRQTRYMTRTNSMVRGKRSLEGDEDQQPEPKRPALASVIVEALKVDSLQKLCSSLEPILRRVVRPISYSLQSILLLWRYMLTLRHASTALLHPVTYFLKCMAIIFIEGFDFLWDWSKSCLLHPRYSWKRVSVVSEEVERALAKLAPPRLNGRSSPKCLEGPGGGSLQLRFRSRLSLPLYTGGKVEGEQGAAIHVVLVDSNTGHVVTNGPEASMKLDVVVLEGDFSNEDDEDWTQEEFDSHLVKERPGKRPLLTGELQVTLKEGVGTLGDLTFTDNSSWIRSRKFRLGLKVASGYCEGIRVREAKTEAFTVKDHRGELYKKHYPPALNDEVWRLEKIGKDGSFHKRLSAEGIFTVEDFLRLVVRDQQKLRNILGSGMSNKMWEALLDHAKTCVLSGKLYVYYTDDSRNSGVVFNNIYELNGLISGEQYFPADSLSDSQKGSVILSLKICYLLAVSNFRPGQLDFDAAGLQVFVDSLVKKAYDNWNQVIEYDGKSLLNFKQNRWSSARNELQMGELDYTSAVDHQMQLPRVPVPVPTEQVHSGLQVGGYNDNQSTGYSGQSQIMNPNSHNQFGNTQFVPQDQLIDNSQQPQSSKNNTNVVGLALGPPQSSIIGFQNIGSSMQPSNLNPFDDWTNNHDKGVEDFLSEEEIRARSNEMLENEEMQHLLRLFNMGGNASINMTEDGGYGFPNYIPSPMPNFVDEDRSRPGKAVVGWLKIKAAMRWGFFIRKKAAERRAQIVELEEEEE